MRRPKPDELIHSTHPTINHEWRLGSPTSSRTLFSTSQDPLHTLLRFDRLALRADEGRWLTSALLPACRHLGLCLYPNYAFSAAVALRGLGESSADGVAGGATAQLQRALLLFPSALRVILHAAAEADGAPSEANRRAVAVWEAATGAAGTPGATLSSLLGMYAELSSSTWRRPELGAWLRRTAADVAVELGDGSARGRRLGGGDGGDVGGGGGGGGYYVQLRDDCAAARAASYGGAASRYDEFARLKGSPPLPLSDALPTPLPADALDGMWDDAGAAAPPRPRPVRPVGRLVVPAEERYEIPREANLLAKFALSLLPWATPPPRV